MTHGTLLSHLVAAASHLKAALALASGEPGQEVGRALSMTAGAIRARRLREQKGARGAHGVRTTVRTEAHEPCANVRPACASSDTANPAEMPENTGVLADGDSARQAHAVRTLCALGGRGVSFSLSSNNQKLTENTEKTEEEGAHEQAHASARNVRTRAPSVRVSAITWTAAGGWSGITDADMAGWREAFPACDLPRQLAGMNEWLLSNPAKARKSQWRRFIVGWLSRHQDRGGDVGRGSRPIGVGVNHTLQESITLPVTRAGGGA